MVLSRGVHPWASTQSRSGAKKYKLSLKQLVDKIILLADNLGPMVVYCPPDQNITATQMNTLVTWNDPQFKDNSNNPLEIRCSHQSGTQFYWGTWNVHCTAFDNNPDNNPAVCQFTLRIKRK